MDQYLENGYFTMSDGQQSNHVVPPNPKYLEQVIQPKGVLSAYILFSESVRNEIRVKNPDIKHTEIMKLVAKEWNVIDDDQR